MPAKKESMQWFNTARFGMFIHWGLYSLLGCGEWVRYSKCIPADEYHALAQKFNPRHFNAQAWAALAKDAGMKYMVLTTKHHDGFCLFDSKYTDFTSVKTAAKRDFVAEYVDACRKAGLGVGLYFSVKDWDFPAYFRGPENDPDGWETMVRHFHNQAMELMTNYGKIDILWYDCPDDANYRGGWGDRTPEVWRSAELNSRIREIQPDILINNRSGLPEDFGTPEGEVLSAVALGGRMYETCMTMNDSWGYSPFNHNWKDTGILLRQLVSCAARGCNYLLNVGPDPDGLIPSQSVTRLRELGGWLSQYGEAVYGTQRLLPNWWDYLIGGRITTRGNTAYLVVTSWHPDGEIVLCSLKNEVISADLLPNGTILKVERDGRRIIISGLPHSAPSALASVVKLELDGEAEPQFYY